jgi:hypothetical protein
MGDPLLLRFQGFTMNDAVTAAAPIDEHLEVRFEFPEERMNRKQRRQSESLINDANKKYRHKRGPAGERPSLIIRVRKTGIVSAQLEAVLAFPEALKKDISGSDKAVFVG